MNSIKRTIARFWGWLWQKAFARVGARQQTNIRRQRRPRIKTLWPIIRDDVEYWGRCFTDKRVDWRDKKYMKRDPGETLDRIFRGIPPAGAYVSSPHGEVRHSFLDGCRVDQRACNVRHVSCVLIGSEREPKREEDHALGQAGITVISAIPCAASLLDHEWYVFNAGTLFEVDISWWTPIHGHALFTVFLVIDADGCVHPTWHHQSSPRVATRRNGGKFLIPSRQWLPIGGRRGWFGDGKPATDSRDLGLGRFLCAMFNFFLERNAHWNCTVKSLGVPPVAFPVLDHDIARIFPKRQRTGTGKIVHWTRTHRRRTKLGETNVRTHIRGNTWWEVDGKSVRITMPGKHHELPSEMVGVVEPAATGNHAVLTDNISGLVYAAVAPPAMYSLLSKANCAEEKIEVNAA